MRPRFHQVQATHTPESLVDRLSGEPGVVLLHGGDESLAGGQYSLVTARPFLTFRSWGARCEVTAVGKSTMLTGNPWHILGELMSRYEMSEEAIQPWPAGGCFGYWGYDLKKFVEPRLPERAARDLDWPDCHVGLYGSLVAFDLVAKRTWVVATGLAEDGSVSGGRALQQLDFWKHHLTSDPRPARAGPPVPIPEPLPGIASSTGLPPLGVDSNLKPDEFIAAVERAQRYIRAGDIYQVNLCHRFEAPWPGSGWDLYRALAQVSPAPYAAFLDAGQWQLASASPELFLRFDGSQVRTRPIKGTRPRSTEPDQDAQLAAELQSSPKEAAELLMITDLLRNDLGRVCEFGSVQVPELVRLERYAHVQHLVSTVDGRLRPGITHLEALKACFPGGSITGAPKIRAMEIIDELEPVARGPYTGCLGYLGFNRQSQLSILIRTAQCQRGKVYFSVGAGIVADSIPAAEYEETLHKAQGFLTALRSLHPEPAGRDARPRASSEKAYAFGFSRTPEAGRPYLQPEVHGEEQAPKRAGLSETRRPLRARE